MNLVFHVAGLSWALASLAVLGFGLPAASVFAAGAAFLLSFIIGRKRLPLWMASSAAAVCLCSLSLLFHMGETRVRADYAGTTQTVRGIVTDQVFSDTAVKSVLRLTADNPAGLKNARILVHSMPGVEESAGDVVEYKVKLRSDPGIWSKGYAFEAFAPERSIVKPAFQDSPPLRQTMASRFQRLLPKGEGALLSGVLLGRTERIPQRVRDDFSKAGISHYLALSGLHLSVILALFGILLRRGLFSRNQRVLLEIALALAFAAFTGFTPSMSRSVSMLVLCRAALLLGRDADSLNSLGFSIILILLINPYAVFSVSLQLSYFATMGICAFTDPMAGWFSKFLFRKDLFALAESRPKTAAVLSALCVTLSAQVLTTPLICWQFGRVSFVSPVTNLFAAFPFTLMLFFGMLCGIFSFMPILTPLCRLSALGAGYMAKLLIRLAHTFASLPWSSFPVRDDAVIVWMAAVTLLLILLWYMRCNGGQVLWAAEWAACALAAALCAHLIFWGRPLTVCVPDYGDTVLLLYGNQAALLGAPKGRSETERLLSVMNDADIASLCLLVSESADALESAAAKQLTRAYPPAEIVSFNECAALKARLFGGVTVMRSGDALQIEAGISIVKTFEMQPAAAHVLINARNETVTRLRLCKNSRYDGCTRIFLPLPDKVQEDTHEV